MFGIIAGILVFLLLIVLHELGHFVMAKRSKVKVLEFGIGIPPKILHYFTDKTGTQYTINAIPLGGFVRLKGEDPSVASDFRADDSFIMASLPRKIMILLGGVIVNFLIAYFGFVLVFWYGVKPIQILPENITTSQAQSYLFASFDNLEKAGLISGNVEALDASIALVASGGLGESIGLQSGDIITHINDQKVNSLTLTRVLKQAIGGALEIDIVRQGQTQKFQHQCPADNCLLGVIVAQSGVLEVLPYQFTFLEALQAGWKEIVAETQLTLHSLGSLFQGLISGNSQERSQSLSKVSGPVGAVKVGEMILDHNGISGYLAFAAMISLALAIFNILPIPALDGGRIVGVLIQYIFGLKPESYFTIENYFNIFFFILMMGFGIYIIFLDLSRFRGVSVWGI